MTIRLSRRDLLASAAAFTAVPALAATGDAALAAMFDKLSNAILTDSPETATFLGLDKGARAGLKARLSDASWDHIAHDHVFCADWLAKLNAVPDAGLSDEARLNKAVVAYALELGRDGGRFAFGSTRSTPP